MKCETYLIEGMHCAACSAAVERVTRKLEGVQRSDVNLTMNRMEIEYDESKVTPEQIIGKIEKAGFGARQMNAQKRDKTREEEAEAEARAFRRERNGIIAALCLAALLMYVSMGAMVRRAAAGHPGYAQPRGELCAGAAHPDGGHHVHRAEVLYKRLQGAGPPRAEPWTRSWR